MFYTEDKVHSFIYFYSHVYLYIVCLFALWVGSLSIYFAKALPDFSNAQCLEFSIDKVYLHTRYGHLRFYPGIEILILPMLSVL